MEPVSGTFELRWQWHRRDDRPPDRRRPGGEPSPVSLDGAAPEPALPALAGGRRRLDEVSPDQ